VGQSDGRCLIYQLAKNREQSPIGNQAGGASAVAACVGFGEGAFLSSGGGAVGFSLAFAGREGLGSGGFTTGRLLFVLAFSLVLVFASALTLRSGVGEASTFAFAFALAFTFASG
jgi:hypothetical protein